MRDAGGALGIGPGEARTVSVPCAATVPMQVGSQCGVVVNVGGTLNAAPPSNTGGTLNAAAPQ